MTTMKLRAPGTYPVLARDEPVAFAPGFGMCDETGHHRYCWIVEPREVIGKVVHGRCASCKRRAEVG